MLQDFINQLKESAEHRDILSHYHYLPEKPVEYAVGDAGLSPAVLAALAEITSEEQPWASPPEITRLLERYNLALFGVDLSTSLLQLREQDYLQEKRDGQQWRYAFTMELLRLWLRQQGELLRLKQQEEAR